MVLKTRKMLKGLSMSLRGKWALCGLGSARSMMTHFPGWSGLMGDDEKMFIVYIRNVQGGVRVRIMRVTWEEF
jgi:hypothetical protein